MFRLFLILLGAVLCDGAQASESWVPAKRATTNAPNANKTKSDAADNLKRHGANVVDLLHDEIFGKDGNKSNGLLAGSNGNVEKGDIPYQVGLGLRDGEKFILCCGGSLISRTWVITAAHCFVNNHHGSCKIEKAVVGESNRDNTEPEEQWFGIRAALVHKDWRPSNFQVGDVALVLLDGMVDFNDYAQPINLPMRSMVEPLPGNAVVSGWGQTTPEGSLSKTLRKAELPVVDTKTCKQIYSSTFHPLVDAHLCAGFLDGGGVDACHGDSGGPLVCKEPTAFTVKVRSDDGWVKEEHERPYLCGVVNFGKFCADPKFPGVYAKVSHYMGWIQETMKYATENLKNEQVEIDKLQGSKNSTAVGHDEEGSPIPNIKYTFVGMVHNGNTLPRGSTDKPCLAVLLSSNLAITASGCVPQTPEEKWKDSSVKVVFGDQKSGGRTTQQAMDILHQFAFKPETFLDQLNAPLEIKRLASRAIAPPGDAVVIQFANSVSFSDSAYPVNFPRTTNFIGLWAEVVGKSTLDSERVAMARAEIVHGSKCGVENEQESDDFICAKIVNGLPCSEFNLGSGLVCRGKSGGNFLCGIVTRKPTESAAPVVKKPPSMVQRSQPAAARGSAKESKMRPRSNEAVESAAAGPDAAELVGGKNAETGRMMAKKHHIRPRNPETYCLFKKFWVPGSHPSLRGQWTNYALATVGSLLN